MPAPRHIRESLIGSARVSEIIDRDGHVRLVATTSVGNHEYSSTTGPVHLGATPESALAFLGALIDYSYDGGFNYRSPYRAPARRDEPFMILHDVN